MDAMVKRSLGTPIRQLTSCLSEVKDSSSRKAKAVRRKSAPCCTSHISYDSSWIRTYQAELHRERKLRQVKFAQKNTERTSMRAYSRTSQHNLSKGAKDSTHLKASRGNKGLPHSLPTNGDSLFGAFQGLSLSSSSTQSSIPALPAEQCKVM